MPISALAVNSPSAGVGVLVRLPDHSVFCGLLVHLAHPGEQSPLARASEERWFVAAVAYLALVAPAAFFWRERVFKSYRAGNTVPPKTYLLGMIGVGLALLTSGTFQSDRLHCGRNAHAESLPGVFVTAAFPDALADGKINDSNRGKSRRPAVVRRAPVVNGG
jgi:hypothetical protein